jgi:hypothetical protein
MFILFVYGRCTWDLNQLVLFCCVERLSYIVSWRALACEPSVDSMTIFDQKSLSCSVLFPFYFGANRLANKTEDAEDSKIRD